MTIEFLIQMINNRLIRLQEDRILAQSVGDLNMIVAIDNEITETQITLNALRGL